ncbi:hypothetical protein JCM3765_004876 [Sporobolomyces pararoseus]
MASTSKASFPDPYVPLSSWLSQSSYSYPCDDCLPLTPPLSSSPFNVASEQSSFPSHFARSRAPSHSPIPFSDRQASKFIELSGLASYRFPTGLLTPDSSRPNSPTRTSFNPRQLPPCLDECFNPSEEHIYAEHDVDEEMEKPEEEEEDEEEFRKRMLKGRSMEFDGDMEEWCEGRAENSSEWYIDEDYEVRID